MEQSQFNLSKIERGAIQELIDVAVKKVLINIADPNTDQKKERGVDLKLRFKRQPNSNFVAITASVVPKLVDDNPIITSLMLRQNGGSVEFEQMDFKNESTEEKPTNTNVVEINTRQRG